MIKPLFRLLIRGKMQLVFVLEWWLEENGRLLGSYDFLEVVTADWKVTGGAIDKFG
jgi:hypothetical protein